jgi:hypothetical protein
MGEELEYASGTYGDFRDVLSNGKLGTGGSNIRRRDFARLYIFHRDKKTFPISWELCYHSECPLKYKNSRQSTLELPRRCGIFAKVKIRRTPPWPATPQFHSFLQEVKRCVG